MRLTQSGPNIILELEPFIPATRRGSGELVALTVEYDDEREITPFSETKHRVPIAVSEWCRRYHSSSELVPVTAGRS